MLLVVFKFIFMLFKPKIILLLCVVSWLICPRAFAEEEAPGNFKNPIAVQEVLTGKRAIANAAWWGFNKDDSTVALQNAINSGASKVTVPYMGSDWIVRPIKLASNQEIFFEPGVVIAAKRGEFKGKNDCLFVARNNKNVILRGYGATLQMRKKDYMSKTYAKSEWRTILALYGCVNIEISGLIFKESGGDGIYLGTNQQNTCKNIAIKNCLCDNNYRQGISIVSAENLTIENCVVKNTKGTKPSAGIALEPNDGKNVLRNIIISNCVFENNSGAGLLIWLRKLSAQSQDISILCVDSFFRNCPQHALTIGSAVDNGPKGLVEFKNCTFEQINLTGLHIVDKSASSIGLRFENCKWKDVAKSEKFSHKKWLVPIYLHLENPISTSKLGGVEFINCHIYDNKNRAFLFISDKGKGISHVKGDIYVHNPYGPGWNTEDEIKLPLLKVIDCSTRLSEVDK